MEQNKSKNVTSVTLTYNKAGIANQERIVYIGLEQLVFNLGKISTLSHMIIQVGIGK